MNRVVALVWHISLDNVIQIPCIYSRREPYQVRETKELCAFPVVRRFVRRIVPQHQRYVQDTHGGSRPARLIYFREWRSCHVRGTHRTRLRFRLILEVILLYIQSQLYYVTQLWFFCSDSITILSKSFNFDKNYFKLHNNMARLRKHYFYLK